MKKSSRRLLFMIGGLLLLAVFFYFQNNSIVPTKYRIQSENIPASFEGYKIVQLSDLHSKSFGKNQETLVKKVERMNPDLIAFTGDLVDSKRDHEENSLILMERLAQIAPVFYVTGNHEWWSGKFESLEQKLLDAGVQVLRDSAVTIHNGKDTIQLIGIDDPAKSKDSFDEQQIANEAIRTSIESLSEEGAYKILLSHRPELMSLYTYLNLDLVFSGHAHGGQFNIPFVGGFVAPNQGFFPKYYAGKYTNDSTTMIVNRGLGNSIIPIRIFNRPEIVVITLKSVE